MHKQLMLKRFSKLKILTSRCTVNTTEMASIALSTTQSWSSLPPVISHWTRDRLSQLLKMQKSEITTSSGAGQCTIYSEEINHSIISLNYEQGFIH